jgi:hypothetical protein
MTRERFTVAMVALSEACGRTISKTLLDVYDEGLRDLGYGPVCAAIKQLLMERKEGDMIPAISTIRNKIKPEPSAKDDALDASHRIWEAVGKFGYGRHEDARKFIGELGWLVVEREGGWCAVCEHSRVDQQVALKAQWRELAISLSARAKSGTLGLPPGVPSEARLGGTPPALRGDRVASLTSGIGRAIPEEKR